MCTVRRRLAASQGQLPSTPSCGTQDRPQAWPHVPSGQACPRREPPISRRTLISSDGRRPASEKPPSRLEEGPRQHPGWAGHRWPTGTPGPQGMPALAAEQDRFRGQGWAREAAPPVLQLDTGGSWDVPCGHPGGTAQQAGCSSRAPLCPHQRGTQGSSILGEEQRRAWAFPFPTSTPGWARAALQQGRLLAGLRRGAGAAGRAHSSPRPSSLLPPPPRLWLGPGDCSGAREGFLWGPLLAGPRVTETGAGRRGLCPGTARPWSPGAWAGCKSSSQKRKKKSKAKKEGLIRERRMDGT